MLLSRFAVRLLLFFALFAVASPAQGADGFVDPLARELKQTGDGKMQEGDYKSALEAYEKATAVEAHPSLLYNRARALQALERFSDALDQFEQFKSTAPPELLARVPQLDEMIARVKEQVAVVSFELPPSVEFRVYVRDKEIFNVVDRTFRFDAGEASLRVEAKGYATFSRSYLLVGGKRQTLKPKVEPLDSRGILKVRSSVASAQVSVDKKSQGMVPVELALSPGAHSVVVEHPKYRTTKTQVVVVSQKTKILDIDLERKPRVYQKWWFWTGVGAVIVGGTALAVALSTERAPDSGDIPPGTITIPVD